MAALQTVSKQYVSALDPMLDTREINKKVTDIANEGFLTDILGLADRQEVATQPVYYNWVNESLFKTISLSGSTITVANVTVSGNTVTNGQVTIVLTAANAGGIVRPGDVIMSDTTGKTAYVHSVTTTTNANDTIIAYSPDGVALTSKFTTSDNVRIISYASGQGSVGPQSVTFGLTKFYNKLQYFVEPSKITNTQLVSTVEAEFNGSIYYTTKTHIEQKLRLKGLVNTQLIAGEMSTTNYGDSAPFLQDPNGTGYALTDSTNNYAVQTTRGLYSYIKSYGVTATANSGTANGTVTLADLAVVMDALTANRAPTDFLVVANKATLRAHDNLFKALGSSGAISSARFEVNGKTIDYTTTDVTYGGYNLKYMFMPLLDNPGLLGGTPIGKSTHWIPLDKMVKTLDEQYQPAIKLRYTPSQSKLTTNQLIGESEFGSLAPRTPSGREQVWGLDMSTQQGLEVLGAQFMASHRILA